MPLYQQLKASINFQPYDIKQFLYQDKAYYDISSHSIKTHNNYCVFYVPIDSSVKLLQVYYLNNFWGTFSTGSVFVLEYTDGSTEAVAYNTPQIQSNWKSQMILAPTTNSGIKGIYITANRNSPYIDNLQAVYINSKQNTLKNNNTKLIETLDKNYYIVAESYIDTDGTIVVPASSGYNNYWINVESGDTVYYIGGSVTTSVLGRVRSYDGSQIEDVPIQSEYVVTNSGVLSLFGRDNTQYMIKRVNSSKIHYSDIVGLPADPQRYDQFTGLSGVCFGTSLTYRSATTSGFLTHLQELSGMNLENQGIGSATILHRDEYPSLDILAAVKNYTNYSAKQICTLEGFVNDWGYNADKLGTWKDTTETTVCGCVRSALNYIKSQNSDILIFLILDHYGRNYGGVDSSSTAVNSHGDTQFEWWEEISKVAESLSVPVIKEYALSGICETAPQYLLDNIHCNELGSIQSANCIWSVIRQFFPNELN